MVDVGPLSASVPDLVRLLTVPIFGYLAWVDVETRRIDNLTWVPLTAVGVSLLALEWQTAAAAGFREWRVFVVTTTISVGFVVSMAYLFHFLGAFGGADARALMTIAVLYPTYPGYVGGEALLLFGTRLPLSDPGPVPVFSFTVLTNAVAWGLAYPLLLAVRNGAMGHVSKRMVVGIPVRWDAIPETHGKLLATEGRPLAERVRGVLYPRSAGLDLDAVRMYLRWRGLSLDDLRADPDRYRDPSTLPEAPNDPTDGAVGAASSTGDAVTDGGVDESTTARTPDADAESDDGPTDPWGAAAFLDDVDGDAYGTSPERLRDGLDRLATDDELWVTPGIPFLVPVFLGLVVAFAYGDVLVGLLRTFGLA
ncbi:A24 family peptidase C-terminal domain-containing protein [Haloarchaeobius sp. HRN-SO-5]|uniref:A24 family peptidase C-terminal domain-containing protein n=1 Tax=Haloarchaeobius sp. HRN-SO-5 TaxID=3446118 RepID=UPI003EB768E1